MDYLYSWFTYPETSPFEEQVLSLELRTPTPDPPEVPSLQLHTTAVARNVPPNIQIKNIGPGVIQQKDLAEHSLKHVSIPPRKVYFPPRHPVLQELLEKRTKIEAYDE